MCCGFASEPYEWAAPNRWFVIAPKANEKQFVTWHRRMFTNHIDIFDAWQKLARPDPMLRALQNSRTFDVPDKESRGRLHNSRLAFLALPVELLSEICLCLSDHDLVTLGATCLSMLDFVCGHIEKELYRKAAPWAGKCLALSRENSPMLPEGFTSMVCDINDDIANECQIAYNFETPTDDSCVAQNISMLAEPDDSTFKSIGLALQDLGDQNEVSPLVISSLRGIILRAALKDSPNADFYLRNLTKRELIQCKPNPITFGGIIPTGRPDIKWFRLDSVLCSLLHFFPEERGIWAGDCFDIVTKRMHEAELSSEISGSSEALPWTDLTETVVNYVVSTFSTTSVSLQYRELSYRAWIKDQGWVSTYGQAECGLKMELLGTREARVLEADSEGYLSCPRREIAPWTPPQANKRFTASLTTRFSRKRIKNYIKGLTGKH